MEDYIFTKRCVHGNANIFSRGLLLFLLASDCLWLSGLDLRDGFISFSDQNGCLTVVVFFTGIFTASNSLFPASLFHSTGK